MFAVCAAIKLPNSDVTSAAESSKQGFFPSNLFSLVESFKKNRHELPDPSTSCNSCYGLDIFIFLDSFGIWDTSCTFFHYTLNLFAWADL